MYSVSKNVDVEYFTVNFVEISYKWVFRSETVEVTRISKKIDQKQVKKSKIDI